MQVHLRKALLDAAHQLLVPVNFQIGMQAALHEHAGSAKLHRFADLVVDGFKIQNVTFRRHLALERAVESAKGAVLGAEVGVVNVAVDDVSDHALRMQLLANGVCLHADADQVIGAKQLYGLCVSQGHVNYLFYIGGMNVAPIKPTVSLSVLQQLDIRVGSIEAVRDVEGSDKLVSLRVNFGDHSR